MIIMILFLNLSVLLILFTVVYLNYKKKNSTQGSSFHKEKGYSKKTKKKQLSDVFQIEIENNMIKINDRYSIVILLGNIDYNMLSNKEQEVIEDILIQTTLAIDYPIQFFSTSEYINTSKIINVMHKNKVKNQKINEYKNYLIKYLENIMENKSISIVKNYAIISCNAEIENVVEELNRNANSFKNNLLSAKIVCEIMNRKDIYHLLYRELNSKNILNIKFLREGVNSLYVDKKEKNRRNKYF